MKTRQIENEFLRITVSDTGAELISVVDKETGKELMVNEKPVVSETSFTAENANGEVKLIYELDSSALKGKTGVSIITKAIPWKKLLRLSGSWQNRALTLLS